MVRVLPAVAMVTRAVEVPTDWSSALTRVAEAESVCRHRRHDQGRDGGDGEGQADSGNDGSPRIRHGSRLNGTRSANVSDSSIAATSRTGRRPNRVMARAAIGAVAVPPPAGFDACELLGRNVGQGMAACPSRIRPVHPAYPVRCEASTWDAPEQGDSDSPVHHTERVWNMREESRYGFSVHSGGRA